MSRESSTGPLVPADALAIIRELAAHLPALKPLFGEIPRVDVVVDANVVLDEVEYWCSLAEIKRPEPPYRN